MSADALIDDVCVTTLDGHAHSSRSPSRRRTGWCLTVCGLATVFYLLGRLGHPYVIEHALLLWPVAVVCVSVGLGLVCDKPAAAQPVTTARSVTPVVTATPAAAPPPVVLGAELDRIKTVIKDLRLPLEVIQTDVAYDNNGRLDTYALHSIRAGYLAKKRELTIVMQQLQGSISGDWDYDIDPERDKVFARRKTPFPAFVAPKPPVSTARSAADATRRYRDFVFGIGVNSAGESLDYSPVMFPHWLCIGGTNSGKSTFVRTAIEQFRAAGWAVFIADGKHTDYVSLNGVANIPMISADTPEHVRLVHHVVEEIDRRAAIAAERKRSNHPNPFAFPPWLVVLDEFASVRVDVQSLYRDDPDKDQAFVNDLLRIVKKGREFRVHMLVATQDLYAKTIPGDMLSNIALVIALGAPSKMTLEKAFTKELQAKAQQIGDTIAARGRGIVADTAQGTVVEFQSYYGYTPGMNVDSTDASKELREQWSAWRDNVSDQVPALYSRQWFALQTADDLALPINELNQLEVVNLDLVDGTPDPAMRCFDKNDTSYVGAQRTVKHGGALRELRQI